MPIATPLALTIGGSLLGAGASIYSGNKEAQAARDAAAIQAESGLAAIEEDKAAREQGRADLQPFTQFGVGQIPALTNILTPEGQSSYLSENNPIFKAALNNLNTQTLNNAAVRGRVGAGDTKQNFLNNFQAAALPLLQNQQNALFNAAGIGQASAAGQANNSLATGQIVGENLTGIGNANAAGRVGATNARTGALQDIFGGLTSVAGRFL